MRTPAMDISELVIAARAGDASAAGELVRRFERYAIAYATTLLDGDVHLAADAAQDAFVEALACLDRLDEPAAFPGWLRPIVRKRAGRIRRRRRERPVDVVPADAREDQPGALLGGPHDVVMARERAAAVGAALRQAAPNDRAVLGLHYLAGWSYTDIADALTLPVSTVRKRLHDARRRFAELIDPSSASTERTSMADAVVFLHAVRGADLHTAAQLLAADRTLTALVEPDDRIHHRGQLTPVRPGYRPLHRAAATGNAHLLRLLLDYGADPRVSDHAGETPLHTAALYGHVDATSLLLHAGGDPLAATAQGLTPRDWALLRGHVAVAELLPPADGERPSRWIHLPRERTCTMPADPTAMLGRTLTVDGAPLDDGDPVDPPTSGTADLKAGTQRLHTGIRVIDVCAPIILGGTVALSGPDGVGQLVVVAEIVHQLSKRGGASVQCGIAQRPIGAATDIREGIAPMGLQDRVAALLVEDDADPDSRERLVHQAIAAAHRLAADRDVLLLLDRAVLDAPEAATNAAGVTAAGSVTVALLDAGDKPQTAALIETDTRLVFDGALAAAGTLPAISPSLSSSRLLDELSSDDAEQIAAAQAVRAADQTARRLRDFIHQPFEVAAPWTGEPGESTAFDEAILQATVQ